MRFASPALVGSIFLPPSAAAAVRRTNVSDDDPRRAAQDEPPSADDAPRKKPYEKPALRYENVFETTALACGKIQGTQGQCRFNRKAS